MKYHSLANHHAKAVGLLKGRLQGFGLRGTLGVDDVFAIGSADDQGSLHFAGRDYPESCLHW